MKLSIIIVNYNVKHFLEQCLYSVYNAIHSLEAEIIVVDNNSSDQSIEMIKKKYPSVILIKNDINKGYAAANNQALEIAKGQYNLLLNPDTIIKEDTLEKSIKFMDESQEAGALGVKILDGSGVYMPESKRSFPSPLIAFYKIFGLSSLFPQSKIFGKYHLGHLDKDEINEVAVLSGSYMFLRKETILKVGLLDESFFMYGEDIDYSYRILKSGYKNYYFPKTSMIHFKGESTKKGSMNYVFMFYKAMIIFSNKHFKGTNAFFFSFLVKLAIYMRASISLSKRIITKLLLPLIDFTIGYVGMIYLKIYWENNHRFIEGGEYPIEYTQFIIPSYLLIWLSSIFLSGAYKPVVRFTKLLRGIFLGTITILVIYALLPESLRFSRALIVLGAIWIGIAFPFLRLFLSWMNFTNVQLASVKANRLLIVGKLNEANRIKEMLNESFLNIDFLGISSDDPNLYSNKNFLGNIKNIKEITSLYNISEIIFSSKDLSNSIIIKQMEQLSDSRIYIKISSPKSEFIIGNNFKNSPNQYYGTSISSINSLENKIKKRLLDLFFGFFLLVSLPISILFIKKRLNYLSNLTLVIWGSRTWVGYLNKKNNSLPLIKPSVISIAENQINSLDENMIPQLNYFYAKNYSIYKDIEVLLRNYSKLGQ